MLAFLRYVSHQVILTGDNIQRKDGRGPSLCCLCACDQECISHMFFEYRFVNVIRNSMMLKAGASFVTAHALTLSLSTYGHQRSYWRRVIWNTWLENNSEIFRNRSRTPSACFCIEGGTLLGKWWTHQDPGTCCQRWHTRILKDVWSCIRKLSQEHWPPRGRANR